MFSIDRIRLQRINFDSFGIIIPITLLFIIIWFFSFCCSFSVINILWRWFVFVTIISFFSSSTSSFFVVTIFFFFFFLFLSFFFFFFFFFFSVSLVSSSNSQWWRFRIDLICYLYRLFQSSSRLLYLFDLILDLFAERITCKARKWMLLHRWARVLI